MSQPKYLAREDGVIFPYTPQLAKLHNMKPIAALPRTHVQRAVVAAKREVQQAKVREDVKQSHIDRMAAARQARDLQLRQSRDAAASNALPDEAMGAGFELDSADAETICQYVQENFNIHLDTDTPLDELRTEARRIMDVDGLT